MKRKSIVLFLIFFVVTGVALAFSTQWSTQFDGSTGEVPDLPDWSEHNIGTSGQRHRLVGDGTLSMRANTGTANFGAYYRDNDTFPNTFPVDQDVRVMWRYRYDNLRYMGTEAGQVTGRNGSPQYYGLSGVDNGSVNYYHVEADGSFGHWDVNNPMWHSNQTDVWRGATFDFICDGQQLDWWVDGTNIHSESNGTPLAPNDPARPYQFWVGSLLDNGGEHNTWTNFHMDYVYIYAVERPQMQTPTGGGGGSQTVNWDPVPNTVQPDGTSWGIQYQARVCSDAVCSHVVDTSPWQSGTSYTFNNLALNQTYYYQARAKWIGTPPLTTCWGNTEDALMPGNPALALNKTAPASAQPGQVIHYGLTVQNTGNGSAENVTVTDPVPQYITNPTNISNGGTLQGSDIVWNLGTLAAGASATLTWDGTVDPAIPVSVSQVVNTATTTDDAGHSDQASATTAINQPGLALSKTVDGSSCYPGGTVGFSIVAQNTGNTTLSGVTVTDPIPNGITNPTNLSNGGTLQGSDIVWNLGTLAAGASATLTWDGTVTANATGQIVNVASVTENGGLSDSASDSCTVSSAQLELSKLAPQKGASGDTLSYVLQVRNTGDGPALNVVLRDPVPQYITNPTNISNGGTMQGSDIVWNLGTLAAGASATLTWDGTVDPSTPLDVSSIENVATLCDGNGACVDASAITELFDAEVSFTKGAQPYGWPGSDVHYTLSVTNTGQVSLTNVIVSDPLPAEIFYPREISHNGAPVEYPFEGRIEIVWNLGDLAPGDSVTLSWLGTVKDDVPDSVFAVRNVANLTSDEGLYREAEGSTYLLHQGVRLDKQATLSAGAGEPVQYTLIVTNPTFAPLDEVVVTDPIPPYIINPTAISGGGVLVQAQYIRWQLGTLAPFESRTLTWQGTVDPAVPATETDIANTATAVDVTQHTAEATAHTTLRPQRLRFVKDATPMSAPGGVITYALRLENTGSADLYDIDVRDPIPAGVVAPQITDGLGTIEGNLTAVWHLDRLNVGENIMLTWQGAVDSAYSGASVINSATVNTNGGLSADASALTVIRQPVFTLRKQATLSAAPGDTVVYTLLLENPSDATAYNIVVNDPIPAGIVNAGNVSAGGELRADSVRWEVDTLAPGETQTLSWQGMVDPAISPEVTEIVNTATASDGSHTLTADAQTNLPAQQLYLYKTASYLVYPGGIITYTLHLENRGQTVFSETVVSDPVPAGVLFPGNISPGGRLEGNTTVVWRVSGLAPGETADMSWQGMVDPALTASTIDNTAAATTDSGIAVNATATSFLLPPRPTLYKQATLSAGAGEPVVYTLTVGNAGLAPAFDLVINDPIPAGIVNAGNVSAGGELRADSVRWEVDTLAPGETQTLSWQGMVDPAISPEVTEIVNTATLVDAGGRTATASAQSNILPQRIRLRKLAPYTLVPGMPLTYTLLVENIGQSDIYDIEVRDPVSPDTSPPPAFISDNGYLKGNTTLLWTLDRLPAGVTRVLSWRGVVNPAVAASTLSNHATLDTATGLSAAADVISYIKTPRLTLNKSATSSTLPGQSVAYTLTLENIGDVTAFAVRIDDPVPDGITNPTNISNGGTLQGSDIVWNLGTLAAGASVSVSWQAAVDPLLPAEVRSIENIATASAAGNVTTDARAVTAIPLRKISLTKLAPSGTNPGESIAYTLIARNEGETTLRGLRLVDMLPQYLTPLTVTAGGYEVPGEIVWDSLPDLAPGAQVSVNWEGMVSSNIPPGSIITNTAEIMSADGIAADALAVTNLLSPTLSLRKSAPAAVSAGGTLTYTLTIANGGPGLARDVMLRDLLPAGLTFINADTYGIEDGGTVTWRFDRLPAGENRSVHLQAQVALDTPPGHTITNTAQVVSPDSPHVITTGAVSQVSLPALSARLTCPVTAQAGDTLPYQLTIANPGESPLRNLLARLTLPADTTPASGFTDAFPDGDDRYWKLGTLPAGETERLAFVLAADPAATGSVSTTTRLQADNGFTTGAACETNLLTPVLALTQTVPATVKLHQTYVVELTVRNLGSVTARNTILTDTLPIAAEYVPGSATNGGAFTDGLIRWQLGDIPPGQSITRHFSVEAVIPPVIPDGAQLYDEEGHVILFNAATVGARMAAAVHSNGVTLATRPRLTLEKTMPPQVMPGDTLTVTLTARVDDAPAQGLTLTDRLPAEFVVLENTLRTGGFYDLATRSVNWALGTVTAGETITRTFAAVIPVSVMPVGQSVANDARLQSSDTAPAYAHATTTVTGTFSLIALKQMSPTAVPGGQIAVSVAVRNVGDTILGNVVIRDPVPGGTHYIDGSATLPPQVEGGALLWNIGALAVGEIREVRFTLQVDDTLPDWLTRIVNVADITFSGGRISAQAVTLLPEKHSVTMMDDPLPTPTAIPAVATDTAPTAPAPVVLIPTVVPTTTPVPAAVTPPATLLPVTGGLFDPHTTGGKVAWGSLLLGGIGLLVGLRKWKKVRR